MQYNYYVRRIKHKPFNKYDNITRYYPGRGMILRNTTSRASFTALPVRSGQTQGSSLPTKWESFNIKTGSVCWVNLLNPSEPSA